MGSAHALMTLKVSPKKCQADDHPTAADDDGIGSKLPACCSSIGPLLRFNAEKLSKTLPTGSIDSEEAPVRIAGCSLSTYGPSP